jgi:hypothetical protein
MHESFKQLAPMFDEGPAGNAHTSLTWRLTVMSLM